MNARALTPRRRTELVGLRPDGIAESLASGAPVITNSCAHVHGSVDAPVITISRRCERFSMHRITKAFTEDEELLFDGERIRKNTTTGHRR